MTNAPIAASTIAAQAFRFMELGPISSFQDDSEQAQGALEQFPIALAMCLERADWSFASRYVSLPPSELQLAQVGDPALPYIFTIPGDCVQVREVQPFRAQWRIDGTTLRCSVQGPLILRYTAAIVNEARLPATFQTAVSYQLALLLAPRWMSVRTKIVDLAQAQERALERALEVDARSASSNRYDGRDTLVSDDWVSGAIA